MKTSLRLRIVVTILFVAIAPLTVVFAWSLVDRNVPGRKWTNVRDALDEAAALVTTDRSEESVRAENARIAERHHVRLRIFRGGETPFADTDADAPVDTIHRIEQFFLGAIPTETIEQIDEGLGPLETRPEVVAAARGAPVIGCDFRATLYCQGVRVATEASGTRVIIVAQASSHRAIATVYLLRWQLLRIGLLTLPVAILLAWYATQLIVRPLERLRAQALDHAAQARRGPELQHEDRDEVGDLAAAFNTLLAALDTKREDNERFAADLAHELKNPVAAIRACAEQLGDGRSADPERAAKLARVLGDSASKLDRVVTHFLELARAEAGMPNEERSPVDLAALAEGITSVLEEDARCEHLTLECAVSNTQAAVVHGAPHRLEALVRELVENAVSFAGEGGRVHVSVVSTGGWVRLAVEDSGPGIRPEDLPRVFERFFTTRGRTRGTGLGLALVKAVAEAHGGTVAVKSELGEGATFSVEFPSV
ncbi:Phosphate regulon sensor protein PhoR (SphS) [Labilithrix luteola]|uniref:histidine kinase n=2 Tax=Labilithrix luteola TaxID=1391654 RepID=A0A0K1Q1T9_9BACT|nr:Phosphate regulon sensor protein PhoR (SphS) [Labilithrix luteola]